MSNDFPHAVRWSRHTLVRELNTPQYTKWHWTEDGDFTICGRPIPIGIDGGTFCPDIDDNLLRVTCKQCMAKIKRKMKE